MMLFTISYVFEEDVTQAVSGGPSTNNPDGGVGDAAFNPYKINYLNKSQFTGSNIRKTGVNKYGNRFVRNGTKDEGYTCWAYNSSEYKFHAESVKRFSLNGTAGKGNEAYAETSKLNQCRGDNKLLEYEIFAGDVYQHNNVSQPEIGLMNYGGGAEKFLKLKGWATLGGFTNHSAQNSSSYVVAVEQINGANTNSTSGVHIFKNRPYYSDWTMTDNLFFGGLELANNGEYNRFRGYLRSWYASDVNWSYFFSTPGTGFYSPPTGAGRYTPGETMRVPANANGDAVYGYGRNFRYNAPFFETRINLDTLYGNGTEDKTYKLYIVKRVQDMIVAGEMSIPESSQTWNASEGGYKSGTLTLSGNPLGKQIEVARTGVLRNTNKNLTSHDGDGVFFNHNEKVDLINIYPRNGSSSIYEVRRKNNGNTVRFAGSQYFRYDGNNTGARLTFKVENDKLTTRHIDPDGRLLRVKSSGSWSNSSNTMKFYTSIKKNSYGVNQLYRDDRAKDNYVHYDPATKKIKQSGTLSKTFNMVPGLSDEAKTLNFHYINLNTVNRFTYRYIDNVTGEVYWTGPGWKYADNDNHLSSNPRYTASVTNSMNPDHSRNSSGKRIKRVASQKFYQYSGGSWGNSTIESGSIKVNPGSGNRVWNIRYEIQPDITIRYYDIETNKTIRTTKVPHWKGQGWNECTTPGVVNKISFDGTVYHRYDLDCETLPNVTTDKTVNIPFVNRPPQPKPKEYGEHAGANQGRLLVNEFGWQMRKENILTRANFEFESEHRATRNATMTKDRVTKNGTNLFTPKSQVVDPLSDTVYSAATNVTKDFNNIGKHTFTTTYDFTNAFLYEQTCELGEDTRCFTWERDNRMSQAETHWGSSLGATVRTVDGKNAIAFGRFNGSGELDVENVLGKDYNSVEDIPEELLVGRNILNTLLIGTDGSTRTVNGKLNDTTVGGNLVPGQSAIYQKGTTNKVYSPKVVPGSNVVRAYNEEIKVEPTDNGTLDTQSGVIVDEKFVYSNDYGQTISQVNSGMSGTYEIGNIDTNLKDSGSDGVTEQLRYDTSSNSFKLRNVYGISEKYGIQFKTPFTGITEGKKKSAMNTQLAKFGISSGADNVVGLDNSVSRYFLPIDSVAYKKGEDFTDSVSISGLGLNEVDVDYEKTVTFNNYLYGNIHDEPVYAEQQDEVVGETYGNSETLSQSKMQEINEALERKDKVNLFRTSDDVELNSHVN